MRRALFITIGTRDVFIDKNKLLEEIDAKQVKECFRKHPNGNEQMLARPAGKLLYDNLKKVQKHLSFPILEPFLKYIGIAEKMSFDHVYLIATDQSVESAGEYSLSDTLHFADIIKQLLPSKHKSNKETLISKVGVVTVKENVIYLDSMFKFFNKTLKGRAFSHLADFDEVHILNQGGIDAINYGLLLNALYLYGKKTHLYNVNERIGLCTPLDFGAQFGFEQEKVLLLQAINRYDYAFVKTNSMSEDLAMWAAYAEARLNFDFDTAYERLSRVSTHLRDKVVKELVDIEKVRSHSDHLTGELYWNAMIRYEQEAYVDFVQRFFRIVEQYAQTKALSYLKKFDYDPKEHWTWAEKFSAFLTTPEQTALRTHLDGYVLGNGVKIKLETASIPVFMSILAFYNPKEYSFLEHLVPLSQIRNKGIGAHGFEPVSIKQILSKLEISKKEFDKLLHLTRRKLKAGDNPFERINSTMLDLINGI